MADETWRPYVYDLRFNRNERRFVLIRRGGWRHRHPGPWEDVAVFYDSDEAAKVVALLPREVPDEQ